MDILLTVSVLYVGVQNERDVLRQLEKCIRNIGSRFFVLEYIDYQEGTQIEAVVHLTLKRYHEKKKALIVLISNSFFDLIWSSVYKHNILKWLLDYSSKHCIHIWLDGLTERDVYKYSSGLCRTDGCFRRIMSSAFLHKSSYEIVNTINDQLRDITEKISYSDYSIQIEEVEVTRSTPSMSDDSTYDTFTPKLSSLTSLSFGSSTKSSMSTIQTKTKTQNKSKPKKKAQNYYQSMAALMVDPVAGGDDMVATDSNKGASSFFSTESKRKKKKKKGSVELLANISFNDLHQISLLLDVGFGANWKQIAASYGIDCFMIKNIELAIKSNESPTQNVLHMLRTKYPELQVLDFMEKCKKISRNDVVTYIRNNVL